MSFLSIPESWLTQKLGNLALIRTGDGAPQESSAFSDVGIPFVRAGSLSYLLNGGSEADLEKIAFHEVQRRKMTIFPPGTIVFAKSGMSCTKGFIYQLNGACCIVNHLATIECSQSIDSRFLTRWFELHSPARLIENESYPSIKVSAIRDLEIPIPHKNGKPDLDEQKRIAAILDKADAIRRKRQQALRLTDDFLRSVFLDMFGDPVTNPKGWDDEQVLGEVAEIASGVTKGRNLDGKETREVPYLAVANVQDKHLKLDSVKTIPATSDEIQKYRLVKHDLLLTEGGDPDKLGRGTLWHNELDECIHQNHVFRVRLTHPEIHPVFLNWLVGSERGKKYFLRSAKQTTGIASINMTQLRAFPLLIPPISLQRRFADISQSIERQALRLGCQATYVSNLFTSLQQRAFRGEL